jgi:hypothetical protein
MGRVVIERPRRGSSNPSLKARKVGKMRLDDADWWDWEYEGPARVPNSAKMEGMWDHSIGTKGFSDVLGPVKGYLKKSVGRKWDEVYSELCAVLGSGSYPIRHVLYEHILRDVETNPLYKNGKVYNNPGARGRYSDYFVHPATGILHEEYKPRWRRKYRRPKTRPETDRVRLDAERWFVFIDGIWYIGTYSEKNFSVYEPRAVKYGWESPYRIGGVEWPDFQNGKTFIFQKIKQASRRELKKYNVRRRCAEQKGEQGKQ